MEIKKCKDCNKNNGTSVFDIVYALIIYDFIKFVAEMIVTVCN